MVSSPSNTVAGDRRVALVIPCFNEAKRLNLEAYSRYLTAHPGLTFCFVNDGSTDSTGQMLTAFEAKHPGTGVRIVSLNSNSGKGEAVRQGILAVLSESALAVDFVGFWDSDLATPLSELDRFLQAFNDRETLQAVVGFRKHDPDAKIQRSFSRRIIGAVMHTIISLYIGLPIRDTQCGAKLFRADLADAIFEEPFVARWTFDIELFFRIQEVLGPLALTQRVDQLHLKAWHDVPGTKLRLQDVTKIFSELHRIKIHYRSRAQQTRSI